MAGPTSFRIGPGAGRAVLTGAAAAGGLLAAAAVVTGAVTTSVARRVVLPPRPRAEDTPVLGLEGGGRRVRLGVTADSVLPGRYSFWFDGGRGHARVGEVLERGHGSVTRALEGVDTGDLAAAVRGRFNGWVHLGPADLGLPFTEVRLQTTLGLAPAWSIPAATETGRWAVLVHGRASVRQEVLRAVPVLHAAGYSCLVVSYRNDGEAPPSADGRYALGDTEWLDVETGMLHALDAGAREIVLMGWSMGGAIALQASTRSRIASVLTGVVLESPVVDWTETLLHHGTGLRLPAPVARSVLALLSSRWGGLLTGQDEPLDLARLDFVARAGELRVPVLVLHGEDDDVAPPDGSRRLAAERPDLVRLVTFPGARHTKLWNLDPARWEGAIREWLDERAVPADQAAGPAGSANPHRA